MDISHVRQLLKIKKLSDIPLRVAFYARVSTDKEEQKTSIKAQQDYYSELIKNNPNWIFSGGYIDEGISGMGTQKREQFQKMVSDACDGKFDLIITKEISRFARNTLDSISYTRKLLTVGVCVWFQNDGINTIDEDSEFRLTIMAGVAQDEIRKLSSRVKFGHAQAIKNGVVLGNSRMYGYKKEHGKLIIDEYEAEMVREIFKKYATGEWSTPRIEKWLLEQGYTNHNGDPINRGTINHIIRNPKYKGYYVGGKVKIEDMFTKKQRFLPQEEWTMYKDDGETVPAIVSEEIWDRANKIFDERSSNIKSHRTAYKTKNLFTGKIFCGLDGAPYYMRQRGIRGSQDLLWTCSYKVKNGAASCKSFTIYESELKRMLCVVLQSVAKNPQKIVESYWEIYQRVMARSSGANLDNVKSKIEGLEKKKKKVLGLYLNDRISEEDFIAMDDQIRKELDPLNNLLSEAQEPDNSKERVLNALKSIASNMEKFAQIKESDITPNVVQSVVKKIIVTPTESEEANIEFYLETDEMRTMLFKLGTPRSKDVFELKDSLFRSDNISLKICPEQTMYLVRNINKYDVKYCKKVTYSAYI